MEGGNVNEARLKSLTYEYTHTGTVGFSSPEERIRWETWRGQRTSRVAELRPRIADLVCACGAKFPEPHNRATGGTDG